MTRFTLPDLGEGLQEAEIVRWHVAVGDQVKVDQPMVAMETAKAIVEVPSPFDGVIVALHGKPGDTIGTGAPLVDFSLAGDRRRRQRRREAGIARGGVVGRMPESDVLIQNAPRWRCAHRRAARTRRARGARTGAAPQHRP